MSTNVTDMIIMLSIGGLILVSFRYLLDFFQVRMAHRTIRDAIREHSTGAAELLAKVTSTPARTHDDRSGLVLVSIGIALIGFTLIVGDAAWLRYGLGASLFPLTVGAALLLRFYRLGGSDAER